MFENKILLYTNLILFSKFECSCLFINKIFIFLNNSSTGLNSIDTFKKYCQKLFFF
jgi:hypothetical protein